MNKFKQFVIEQILRFEGGYVDNPADRGGKTNLGITEEVARACGFTGDMKDLTKDFAINVYCKQYFDPIMFDELAKRSPLLAELMVDIAVNNGVKRAGEFLQRALSNLNNPAQNIIVDGVIGAKTITAMNDYLDNRSKDGEKNLIASLIGIRLNFYHRIVENDKEVNPKKQQRNFINGWINHRITPFMEKLANLK